MKQTYRSITIRENGQEIGTMAMSNATVRRYMNNGFKLWIRDNGQVILSR